MKKQKVEKFNSDLLEPDILILDEEWIHQPKFYYEIAKASAKAGKAEKTAKANMNRVGADLSKDIAQNPKKYGLKKTTDKMITNAILLHPKYQKAENDYIEAEYKHNVMIARSIAAAERKTALENLVMLHGQNYFSTPQAKTSNAKDYINKERRKKSVKKVKMGKQ